MGVQPSRKVEGQALLPDRRRPDYCTVNVIVVECCRLPEVPVTFSV